MNATAPESRFEVHPYRSTLRIVVMYVLFSAAWIYLGDLLLLTLANDPETLTRLQTYKGLAFIVLSAVLIFFLVSSVLAHAVRLQQQLKIREQYLHTVLDTTVDGFWLIDKNKTLLQANQAYCAMSGYTAQELEQLSINDLDVLETPEEIEEHRQRIMANGAEIFETVHRRKDGTTFPVEVSVTWRPDIEDGRLVCFCRDITERKKSEAQIQEKNRLIEQSERRFRHIFEHTPHISVQGYDHRRRVIFWNRASQELYGYSHAEALGRPLEQLIIPEPMRQEVINAVCAWVNGGAPIPAGELTLQHKNGSPVEVFSSHVMLSGPDGPEMYCIDIDLTQLHRAQTELTDKKLEIEQFVYVISHDLRSPLITIRTFLDLLRQDIETTNLEQIDSDFNHISRAADKIEQLLNALLQLSRIGRMHDPQKRISLKALIEQSLEALAGAVQQQKVRIEIHHGDQQLYGSSLQLTRLWQNLIENAVKYLGDQPQPLITVGVDLQGDEPVFFVRDNGIGIAAQDQDRIFRVFTQVDPTRGGVGLGLTLAKKVTELYGGRIWAESAGAGQGSCFKFTLPLALHPQSYPPEKIQPES